MTDQRLTKLIMALQAAEDEAYLASKNGGFSKENIKTARDKINEASRELSILEAKNAI